MRISDWSSDVCSSDLQRRALLLPQELMQFPTDKLILLRGGIPPIIGTKIAYFSSRFFKTRAFPAPEVPAAPKRTTDAARHVLFRDMTVDEAAGHDTRNMSQDDVITEDCTSLLADMLKPDHNRNDTGPTAGGEDK